MAFTLTQLEALEAAYASGLLEVMFQGRREVYASGADLLARINLLKQELADADDAAASVVPTRIVKTYMDDQG